MYFPKSQITTNLYTNGREYVYVGTEKEYIGFYFKTSNGKYYTGKNPNDPPVQELVIPKSSKVNDAEEGEIGNYSQEAALYLVPDVYASSTSLNLIGNPPLPPTQVTNLPTEKDYNLGEYQRYFSSKNNEIKYIEINQNQYEKFINQEPNVDYSLYTAFKFPWLISGNRNEASKVNKKTIERISSNLTLSGFNSYFKNKYDQYFKYSKNEGLYTDGNEFINSFTRKPYIGFYHIHPKKGPMVGAQHIEGPHAYLYAIKEYYKQKVTGSLRVTSSMDEVFEYGGYNFKKGNGLPPLIPPIILPSFITTWNVPSNNFDIIIGLDPSQTYDFTIDWGDGNEETITSNNDLSHTYSNSGEYTVTIDGTFPRIMMNRATATHDNLISINNWGNIKWKNMEDAFKNCVNLYKCPTNDFPDVSFASNMVGMFENAGSNSPSLFINNIENWVVPTIQRMFSMFKNSTLPSYNLSSWDVSNVKNFSNMFGNAIQFNGSLIEWETTSATFMGSMFQKAKNFNQPLNHFDVSGVTKLNFMFQNAHNFNQPLNNWDVSNVNSMTGMFNNCFEFNQPIGNWDVSNVKDMQDMFNCSTQALFDQDISDWKITKVSSFFRFLRNQKLSDQNYKNLLIKWEQTLQAAYPNGSGYPYLTAGVDVNFGDSEYPSAAASARSSLETNYNWTIIDGGLA
tara:strand:+ start:5453 stop:7489 length:2037 start_codon:yes stop_codon:yes gene_type:complete